MDTKRSSETKHVVSDDLLFQIFKRLFFVQRVADFAQQQYFFARLCRCFFNRRFGFFHGVQCFDNGKNRSSNDQEADNGVNEQAEVQGNSTGCLGCCQAGIATFRSSLRAVFQGNEQVGEVNAADQQCNTTSS